MKTTVAASLLLLFSFSINAQNQESINIGKKEIIHSKILDENRKIWVYTPNTSSQNASPDKRFPVLYLLDGDAHFYSTVGIIQQLSQANGNGVLPEMIVVAIENTNRLRDLVPSDDFKKPNAFVNFVSSELVPYIDKSYNTAPFKLLVGHSLGGLTAIDILTNKPDLFNAYIAIDPSMWYNKEMFLKNTIAQLPKQKMNGKRLFVGIANTMPKGGTIRSLNKDISPETQHIRSIFKMDQFIKANNNGLLYAQKYYETERHNTVPLITELDGLRFIFDYYQLDLSEKDFADSSAYLASKLREHYLKVSDEMGYKNSAPQTFINYLAYEALGKKQFIKAKSLFELNIECYPDSSDVYDSYADYFLAKKDTANAIANYKKSLQVKNDPVAHNKLNAISNQKTFNYTIDYIKKFTGTYTLTAFNLDMKLGMRDGKLWAIVPGQADSELLPIFENVFTVKGQQGYAITFEMSIDKPKGFTSVQPNGTFEAVFKSK